MVAWRVRRRTTDFWWIAPRQGGHPLLRRSGGMSWQELLAESEARHGDRHDHRRIHPGGEALVGPRYPGGDNLARRADSAAHLPGSDRVQREAGGLLLRAGAADRG